MLLRDTSAIYRPAPYTGRSDIYLSPFFFLSRRVITKK
jgi:hypothetical protein